MRKLKDIRSIDDLKEFILLNKETIKKAALPVTVAAALLFFWAFGGEKKEEIKESQSPAETKEQAESTEEDKGGDIYVDISGCVKEPGVYQVSVGTRIFQVIEEAGGITDGADISSVNRAEEVTDGQKIVIYSKEDISQEGEASESYAQTAEDKVNINKADSSKLQTVPGIGPATAQKIIEYREKNGRFSSIDDLKNVSGIGDKTLENMREYITV